MRVSSEFLYKHNIGLFSFFEFTRALIFIVSIWVAFERQYITATQLTFIEGLIIGTQLLLELPTGALADLIGKRYTVAFGYIVKAVSLVVYGFSTSFLGFVVFALLYGSGEALESGAREALLYDTMKEAGREGAYDKVSSRLGIIFQSVLSGATFVGGLLGMIMLQLPIWLYSAAMLLTGFISFRFIEPHIDTERFTLRRYLSQTKHGIDEILKTSHSKKVSLFYVLVGGISWSCMVMFNTIFMVDLGYTVSELGTVGALQRFFNSVVLFRLVHIAKVVSKTNVYIFFPILIMMALLPGIYLTKWIAIPFVSMAMMSSTARWVILGKYVNEEFSSRNRATALSTLSMAIGVIYVFFAWASGPIIEWWGSASIIYTIFGILSAVTILPLGIHLARYHASSPRIQS